MNKLRPVLFLFANVDSLEMSTPKTKQKPIQSTPKTTILTSLSVKRITTLKTYMKTGVLLLYRHPSIKINYFKKASSLLHKLSKSA